MGILDSKDGTLSIFRVAILNAAIILPLGWVTGDGLVPVRLTMLIAYPALLIFNFLFFWKAYREHRLPKRTTGLSKRRWLGTSVFTVAALIELIYWIRNPDVRSTVQVIIGALLAAWMWYLALGLWRAKRED
jgi:hypothetical protein